MIFLTVGSQLPFGRLLRSVDAWCASNPGAEVFGQIADPGGDGYYPRHFEWTRFLEPSEFDRLFRQARIIIAHAGMGSIIDALMAPKPIVVMPRWASLDEHRNDHQIATAEKFQYRSNVQVAADEQALPSAIEAALAGSVSGAGCARAFADESLINAVRSIIVGSEEPWAAE